MSKTIALKIDDNVYEIFKKAADGQRRTISNYIEFATLNYTVNETIVDDKEMSEIITMDSDIKQT
ncbi:MAG: CopG family transcriptional regulator [Spirochaetes bacterium GWF1_31_7]|nr:MAG: CopG family transcriptional regulator [Spirochaetes bacterium GWE1_32_154]OHD45653.1 MAG: CopG family transcriptional regulator [Spirochaetes bacterium GWE2_31_10]OHD48224.1 MAG: CopG family transcriptional regulator [Spirochaetes bacterium GWF1_31_7]HBD95787.1 CopG family transcriptional regulator [Spirochaetia bacterium]HBI37592.1 CopG family transcriptional regulator [Spirochaetia bacterium]